MLTISFGLHGRDPSPGVQSFLAFWVFQLLCLCFLYGGTAFALSLKLIASRDHIEGSLAGSRQIYADAAKIYLATSQGTLFVLARDRSRNFPLLETINPNKQGLGSIAGDEEHIYMTSGIGELLVYQKGETLKLTHAVKINTHQIGSVVSVEDSLYVSKGSGSVAVGKRYIYFSMLNEQDAVLEVSKSELKVMRVFAHTFDGPITVVFDKQTGRHVGTIPNPPDLYGRVGGVHLYVDDKFLIQTIGGCCGSGIFIYDAETLKSERTIPKHTYTTVVRRGHLLIAGSEWGHVVIFDLDDEQTAIMAIAPLRVWTDHKGLEDIEIRCLWIDGHDELIFAGSSWGNDHSRGPLLPSFFVLELS